MYIGPWQEYNLAKHSRHLLNQSNVVNSTNGQSSTPPNHASASSATGFASDYGTPSQQYNQRFKPTVASQGSSLRRRLPPSANPPTQNRSEGYSRILAGVVPSSSSPSSKSSSPYPSRSLRPPQTPPLNDPSYVDDRSAAAYMYFQQQGRADYLALRSPSVRSEGAYSSSSEPAAMPSYAGGGLAGRAPATQQQQQQQQQYSSNYNPALAARMLKISRQHQSQSDDGAMFKKFFTKAVDDKPAAAAPKKNQPMSNLEVVEARKRAYLQGIGVNIDDDVDGKTLLQGGKAHAVAAVAGNQNGQQYQQQHHVAPQNAPLVATLPVDSKKPSIKNIELSDEAFNLVAHYFQDDDEPSPSAHSKLHSPQQPHQQHASPLSIGSSPPANRPSPSALQVSPLRVQTLRQGGVLSHSDASPPHASAPGVVAAPHINASHLNQSPSHRFAAHHAQQQHSSPSQLAHGAAAAAMAYRPTSGAAKSDITTPRTPIFANNGGASVDELIRWVGGLNVDAD